MPSSMKQMQAAFRQDEVQLTLPTAHQQACALMGWSAVHGDYAHDIQLALKTVIEKKGFHLCEKLAPIGYRKRGTKLTFPTLPDIHLDDPNLIASLHPLVFNYLYVTHVHNRPKHVKKHHLQTTQAKLARVREAMGAL